MTKIYFAGSIRGGRQDAELYNKIITLLKQNNIVLTEHVGNPNLSNLETDTTMADAQRDAAIYTRDTEWLKQSDLVIAECTTTSHGVGYELAYAEKLNIPCHIFYNKTRCRLSAMLTGNPYFHIHPYTTEQELLTLLPTLCKELANLY